MVGRAGEGRSSSAVLAITATIIAAGVMLWIAAQSSEILQPPTRIPYAVINQQHHTQAQPTRTSANVRRHVGPRNSGRRSGPTAASTPLPVVQIGGSIAIPTGVTQRSQPSPSSAPAPAPKRSSSAPAPQPAPAPQRSSSAPAPQRSTAAPAAPTATTPAPTATAPAPTASVPPASTTTTSSTSSSDQASSSSRDTVTTSPDGSSIDTVTTTTTAGGS